MPPRTESDEKYILDLVAEILAEPDYRWQHRFPTLLGDPGLDGKPRRLPVDGYFPRHRLIVEYWEKQHSSPVPIMDEGMTVSGVSRGHQRRLYDQRRQAWADANGMKLVILDYRGFQVDQRGRIHRRLARDRQTVAGALQAAGALVELDRRQVGPGPSVEGDSGECRVCRLIQASPAQRLEHVIWQSNDVIAYLNERPTAYGHTLVAPTIHLEQVTGDFTLHRYLGLQRVLHAVAEALRKALRSERVYVLSLGDQESEAHVLWHIVPCPPGLSSDQQKLTLVDLHKRGILRLSQEGAANLVGLLQAHLPAWMKEQQS